MWEKVIFFSPHPLSFLPHWSVIQAPCTRGNLHTHTLPEFFPTTLVTFFTCKYPEMTLLWCVQEYFPPPLSISPSPHSSVPFACLISLNLFDFHPPLAVISPPSRCQSTPLGLSLPSFFFLFLHLFAPSHAWGCRWLDYTRARGRPSHWL